MLNGIEGNWKNREKWKENVVKWRNIEGTRENVVELGKIEGKRGRRGKNERESSEMGKKMIQTDENKGFTKNGR